MKRFLKVICYGWKHSKSISCEVPKKSRIWYFIDILRSYHKYHIYSNEYIREKFYLLDSEDRETIGKRYLFERNKFDAWWKDFYANRAFLSKFTSRKWEESANRMIERNEAYKKRYNMGDNCHVEYNVELSRQHELDGSIRIGENVLLAKNVFIDYTGHVTIEDNVKLANGVIIESHYRDIEAYEQGRDVNIQTNIHICEGAYIGSRAIILSSCHYIGKHARIGANAVVTKDVPDYALVAGVPAKVIKMLK